MKKTLILAAAALLLAVAACAPKQTNAEKTAAFQAEMEKIMADYNEAMRAIDASDRDAASALEDAAIEKIRALGLETMKKNPKDSVSLLALQNCYYYAEPEDIEAAISKFSDDLKADPFVQKVSESLVAKLATKEGSMFTDFTVDHVLGVDAEGNEIIEKRSLSDYVGKGKYVLVDFWSPWCPPCKAELPNIKAVYEKYAGEKFDILSVAVWEESRKMDWRNTIDTAAVYGITWNQINNGHREPASLYGIDGIPHVILFAPDGTILKRDLRGEALEQAVAAAVAE